MKVVRKSCLSMIFLVLSFSLESKSIDLCAELNNHSIHVFVDTEVGYDLRKNHVAEKVFLKSKKLLLPAVILRSIESGNIKLQEETRDMFPINKKELYESYLATFSEEFKPLDFEDFSESIVGVIKFPTNMLRLEMIAYNYPLNEIECSSNSKNSKPLEESIHLFLQYYKSTPFNTLSLQKVPNGYYKVVDYNDLSAIVVFKFNDSVTGVMRGFTFIIDKSSISIDELSNLPWGQVRIAKSK